MARNPSPSRVDTARPRPPVGTCPGCPDVPTCNRRVPLDAAGQPTRCARCAGPAPGVRSQGRPAGAQHGDRQQATDARLAAWATVEVPPVRPVAAPVAAWWRGEVGA